MHIAGSLALVQGDTTRQKTAALVNVANSTLPGRGGVDKASLLSRLMAPPDSDILDNSP